MPPKAPVLRERVLLGMVFVTQQHFLQPKALCLKQPESQLPHLEGGDVRSPERRRAKLAHGSRGAIPYVMASSLVFLWNS